MTTVLIPAAGRGTRVGGPTAKQFLEVGGESILARTLLQVQECPDVDCIIVATGSAEIETVREIANRCGISKLEHVLEGGAERQDSVALAFAAIHAADTDIVVIHDAVRPFADTALFSAVIRRARETGAAIAGRFVTDTVKQVEGDRIVATLDRSTIVLAQTPQAFQYEILRSSIESAAAEGWRGTDEASLVERAGYPVAVVDGSPFNIKVTRHEDLVVAEAIARSLGSGRRVSFQSPSESAGGAKEP